MDELAPRVLNHISLFSFTDAYWLLNENARRSFHDHWLNALSSAATNVDIYQNTDTRADMLVWCALNATEASTISDFFGRFAVWSTPFRQLLRPVDSFWGLTEPSPDAKAYSPQEIDPLSATRLQYLVAYPFGSGVDWYGLTPAFRRETMDKYVELGNQYEDVKQLVLHAFGLQGHEFVLLYETDDMNRFSAFARELRNNDAGRFARQDKPAYTALYHPAAQTLALWK